jgi:hypothetical protein
MQEYGEWYFTCICTRPMQEETRTYPHFDDRRVAPVFESYHRLFTSALCVSSYIRLAHLLNSRNGQLSGHSLVLLLLLWWSRTGT